MREIELDTPRHKCSTINMDDAFLLEVYWATYLFLDIVSTRINTTHIY